MGTLLAIVFIYIIYYIFSVNRYDKNGHYKDKRFKGKKKLSKSEQEELKKLDYDRLPGEVRVFVDLYKVDLDKVNIRGLLKLTGLILGMEIGAITILMVIIFKNNILISVIVGFILMMILYLISLKLLANNFKKRGLIKNGK